MHFILQHSLKVFLLILIALFYTRKHGVFNQKSSNLDVHEVKLQAKVT